MVEFSAMLQKFGEMGEKTGWTYFEIPAIIAQQIKPDTRKSFRVKGKIDNYPLKMVALLPMGEGAFLIPLKAEIRSKIRKEAGATVLISLEEDTDTFEISSDLMACLEDEPLAKAFFKQLPSGHQKYYSNWIEAAKTLDTKTKRILMSIKGFRMGMNYPEMMRHYRDLGK